MAAATGGVRLIDSPATMKIVHTSDWHIGRRWKGIQRMDELEAVLDHLAAFIEREAIDLVLHTGDVFENRNPPAEAEQLVNRFLVRVGRTGAQMLVIAGNHDDPLRLDARSLLTEHINTQILGRPRPAFRGGTRTLVTRSGETAVIAALPFASPGAWVSALDLAGEEAAARGKYARMFELAVQDLCEPFRKDAVNILMRTRTSRGPSSANRSAASISRTIGPPRPGPCRLRPATSRSGTSTSRRGSTRRRPPTTPARSSRWISERPGRKKPLSSSRRRPASL